MSQVDKYGNINGYPPRICGPTFRLFRGEYNESAMEDITINNKNYKIDTYGNISGWKGCLFSYDSAGYLEEIGIWKNTIITNYTFGYSYW
jgi:hypothetical protein|tara:strand:- start:399 stop:668 length:270 start_codon:yes stop_codon:yes gene_type:complete